jgi:predicted permease
MIERLYRALLRFYPSPFRARFGEEVLETARALDRRGGGFRQRLRALIDGVHTAGALHAEYRYESRAAAHGRGKPMPIELFIQDVRFALRGLRREPLFALLVISTLALATGANAALFGIADRLLFRGPLHVSDPGRVARLYVTTQPTGMREFTSSTVGHVTYDIARRAARSAEAVASFATRDVTTGRGAAARPARMGAASASFFRLLGVRPVLGRFFSVREDAVTGAERVAVISEGVWRREFGAAPDVIGRPVTINDDAYVVIGVAPRGFTGTDLGPIDFWTPISLLGPTMTTDWTTSWSAQWHEVIVRVREGATRESAAREITDAVRSAYAGDEPYMKSATLWLGDLAATDGGVEPAERRVVRWLSGVAGVVLLIACANLMNILLARGARRIRDIGVRLALGASRGRLVRMLLIESTLLSLGGAAAGLLVAHVIGGLARRALLDGIEWASSPVDVRVFAMAMATAVAIGILIGVVPALAVTRAGITGALRTGVRDGGGDRHRLRGVLTVVQATLSVALLIGGGLFVRSTWNARNLDLGFDARRVIVVEATRAPIGRIPDPKARDAERLRRRTFFAQAVERIRFLPGVGQASVAVGMPFGMRFGRRVRVPGLDALPKVTTGGPSVSAVSHDYFATMGTSIVRGRGFTAADRAGSAPVAIVSEFMAHIVWPDVDPVGRCVIIGDEPAPCATIVGVAEDTHRARLIEDPKMHVYLPLGQEVGFGGAVLLVRGGADPMAHADAIRRELLAADATITFVSAEPIQARIDPLMRSWELGTTTLAFSGLLALIVAAVGIYSVLSYLVADRRHEIGVRIALGARVGHVTGIIMRWSIGMVALGIAIGSVIAAATATFVQPLLFNVSARDPMVFAAVAGILLLVAVVASLIPAMRAAHVDPLEALRAE